MITSVLLWRKQPAGKNPFFQKCPVFFFGGGKGVFLKTTYKHDAEGGSQNDQKKKQTSGVCTLP